MFDNENSFCVSIKIYDFQSTNVNCSFMQFICKNLIYECTILHCTGVGSKTATFIMDSIH